MAKIESLNTLIADSEAKTQKVEEKKNENKNQVITLDIGDKTRAFRESGKVFPGIRDKIRELGGWLKKKLEKPKEARLGDVIRDARYAEMKRQAEQSLEQSNTVAAALEAKAEALKQQQEAVIALGDAWENPYAENRAPGEEEETPQTVSVEKPAQKEESVIEAGDEWGGKQQAELDEQHEARRNLGLEKLGLWVEKLKPLKDGNMELAHKLKNNQELSADDWKNTAKALAEVKKLNLSKEDKTLINQVEELIAKKTGKVIEFPGANKEVAPDARAEEKKAA